MNDMLQPKSDLSTAYSIFIIYAFQITSNQNSFFHTRNPLSHIFNALYHKSSINSIRYHKVAGSSPKGRGKGVGGE